MLQVDGYAVYKQLAGKEGLGDAVTLAFCWAHVRRKFYEIYVGGNAPIATEALVRIRKLYAIETEIRGGTPEVRRTQRQARSKPIVDALRPWLEESLAKISKGSKLADAIRYGLNHSSVRRIGQSLLR